MHLNDVWRIFHGATGTCSATSAASVERLEPAIAMYLIIAWRVMLLKMTGRRCPDLACDAVFETEEWQAIYIVTTHEKPPEEPPPLDTIVRMLAGFGGYLDRKHDGPPGNKRIWIGLQRWGPLDPSSIGASVASAEFWQSSRGGETCPSCKLDRTETLDLFRALVKVAALKKERPRPVLDDIDRAFWVALRAAWPGWASRLVIVNPDTVAKWNRDRFRRYWAKVSQRQGPGPPRVDAEIRRLICSMARDGRGAPRIHGELTKLGLVASEATPSRATCLVDLPIPTS